MNDTRKASPKDRERGRELSRKRKSLGITQAEIADRIGVSTQQYGKYERGENRMSVERYEAILAYFSASPGAANGLREARQAEFETPITKAALQKSLDQMRATLDLWQRYLDRM